jgi:hypothetical protein
VVVLLIFLVIDFFPVVAEIVVVYYALFPSASKGT